MGSGGSRSNISEGGRRGIWCGDDPPVQDWGCGRWVCTGTTRTCRGRGLGPEWAVSAWVPVGGAAAGMAPTSVPAEDTALSGAWGDGAEPTGKRGVRRSKGWGPAPQQEASASQEGDLVRGGALLWGAGQARR